MPKILTKRALMKLLESVPDNAVGVYFSGDEELRPATTLIVKRPGDQYYFRPEGARWRTDKVWFELGEE